MALEVINVSVEANLTSGSVEMKSTLADPQQAIAELNSPAARQLAIKSVAEKGMQKPAIRRANAPYPVEPGGKPFSDHRAAAKATDREYRATVSLLSGAI